MTEPNVEILTYGVPGYLCFARSDKCGPGNKGGFIKATGVKHFCDDSKDHVFREGPCQRL